MPQPNGEPQIADAFEDPWGTPPPPRKVDMPVAPPAQDRGTARTVIMGGGRTELFTRLKREEPDPSVTDRFPIQLPPDPPVDTSLEV